MKRRACKNAGILSIHKALPEAASIEDILAATKELVCNPLVDGVLVQMPLPNDMDSECVIRSIPPEKDVDGFHPFNLGSLASENIGVPSCTPAGVMTLLDHYNVELAGKKAVVVGRSRTVGLPMSLLLMARDATVTVAHKQTYDLAAETRQADILILAAGAPNLITKEMVKPGAVVIDIGITRTDDGLVGDVAFDEVKKVASLITPVPGGVGPMTIATLLQTTLKLANSRAGQSSNSA
jgi:methylenetetrahydrofolate dehydrogenase (NADP+)/methenyltetrahydrofolate cyclohydrolase